MQKGETLSYLLGDHLGSTSIAVDTDKEETLIATYGFHFVEFASTLKIFTLGDGR